MGVETRMRVVFSQRVAALLLFLQIVPEKSIIPEKAAAFIPQIPASHLHVRHLVQYSALADDHLCRQGHLNDDDDDEEEVYEAPSFSDETTVWLNPRESSQQGPLSLQIEPWWDELQQQQRAGALLVPNEGETRSTPKRRWRYGSTAAVTGATTDHIHFEASISQHKEVPPKQTKTDRKKKSRKGSTKAFKPTRNREWVVTRPWNETNVTLFNTITPMKQTMKSSPVMSRFEIDAAFRIPKEPEEVLHYPPPPAGIISDKDSYRKAALEYWKTRLMKKDRKVYILERLLKLVPDRDFAAGKPDNPFMDLQSVDQALCALAASLPRGTSLSDAARLVSRYTRLLRIASTTEGQEFIRQRIDAVQKLLPAIAWKHGNNTIYKERKAYTTLLSHHLSPSLVFDPKLDWCSGSELDKRINILTGILFPTIDNGSVEWEQCRTDTVRLAPSLVRKDWQQLRKAYRQFPAACLGGKGHKMLTAEETAAGVIRKCPRLLLKDVNLLRERREVLEQWLPSSNVSSLIYSCPQVLTIDVATRVPEVLASLRHSLPGVNIELLIQRAPQLLLTPCKNESIDQVLSRRVATVATLLSDQDEVPMGTDMSLSSVPQNKGDSVSGNDIRSTLVRYPRMMLQVNKKSPLSLQTSLETKIAQLAMVLNVPISGARKMVRRAPSLAGMDIEGTIAQRCIDLTLLLQCSPTQLTSVVKRYPPLLTYRIEALSRKLVELEHILEGEGLKICSMGTEASDQMGETSRWLVPAVSDSTLAIVRRVPRMLGRDIAGSLAANTVLLRKLLLRDSVTKDMGEDEKEKTFRRVLNRCPELLLFDIENTVAPKIHQLRLLLPDGWNDSEDGAVRLALKEPRLLTYDIEGTLVEKAKIWRARVQDPNSFDLMLAQYPTLLMYSFGAAARLEYFAYCNKGIMPDAVEARQLLMLSRRSVQRWGEFEQKVSKPLPSLLGGAVTKQGRPRIGETAKEAVARRGQRIRSRKTGQVEVNLRIDGEKVRPSVKRPIEELKVVELRHLVKTFGGKPSTKRKHALVQELKVLGCEHEPDLRGTNIQGSLPVKLLSYSEWIASQLCNPLFDESVKANDCPNKTFRHNDKVLALAGERMLSSHTYMKQTIPFLSIIHHRRLRSICSDTLSLGKLEKLYGMTLRGSVKAEKAPLHEDGMQRNTDN